MLVFEPLVSGMISLYRQKLILEVLNGLTIIHVFLDLVFTVDLALLFHGGLLLILLDLADQFGQICDKVLGSSFKLSYM